MKKKKKKWGVKIPNQKPLAPIKKRERVLISIFPKIITNSKVPICSNNRNQQIIKFLKNLSIMINTKNTKLIMMNKPNKVLQNR